MTSNMPRRAPSMPAVRCPFCRKRMNTYCTMARHTQDEHPRRVRIGAWGRQRR